MGQSYTVTCISTGLQVESVIDPFLDGENTVSKF